MACKIGLIIYCILQFVAFVFILVGTPIDQFRSKTQDILGDTSCITFWGQKNKCYSTTVDIKTNDLWAACSSRKSRFQAAEAFSIISIFVFGAACVLGFVQLCCCSCFRWICLILNIVGVVTACICWACMADAYNSRQGCFTMKSLGYKYGAGFALYVVGWALCLVNIVFLMLPC